MIKARLVPIVMLLAFTTRAQSYKPIDEEFNDSLLHSFVYGSGGVSDAFKWQSGVVSSGEPKTMVLLFKIDSADPAGAGRGPEIISKDFTGFGTYSARLKIPDVRKLQPNTGAVVGYFTYNEDSLQGLSEIDFEWLVADPGIIYIGTWTGPKGKLQRIGRTIQLDEGKIFYTIEKVNHDGIPAALSGDQNQPETLAAIPGYDASARFYTYGFDWWADRLRWWIVNAENGKKVILWDYQGSVLGIPQVKTKYRMNFWYSDNWAAETNPYATEKPLNPYPLEIDWMKYQPSVREALPGQK